MRKVLFIATVVKTHIMEFHIPYLEWFKQNGYEVHVAARNDYAENENCQIPYCDKFYDLPFERSPVKRNNFNVYQELRRIIDQNEYELIHCHTPVGGAMGRLTGRDARRKGTKVIYTAHGFHFYKGSPALNWMAYYPVEKWLAAHTDVLVTINQEDYNLAKSFKPARLEYVPGIGIDTNRFRQVTIDREEKRNSLGVSPQDTLLLSVGELNKNKNHQILIRAVAESKDPGLKYVICGQGPLEMELLRLIGELKLENQVKLLGYRSDIPELLNAADLFSLPSHREGLSLSLMEAMAAGLPVICSNIRGNRDLIESEKGGFLVQPDHLPGFTEALGTLRGNSRLQSDFGAFNARRVNDFSLSRVMGQMEGIYLSLIGSEARPEFY